MATIEYPSSATAEDASTLDAVKSLRGLPFDDFVDASYDALLLRSPERVTAVGRAEDLGVRNDRLDDLSAEYLAETQALERAVLDLLHGYDRSDLTRDQQLSYDVYQWVLDDAVRSQRFAQHDYPITHCRVGHHYGLLSLLLEAHPLETPEDAADYVSRLARVQTQVEQLLAGMDLRAVSGVVPPRFIIGKAQEVLADYLGTTSRDPEDVDAAALSVYTTFSKKLEGISALSAAERDVLRGQALDAIKESFIPAYVAQLDYLDRLAEVATDDAGVWKLPEGDAYYAFLLRSRTTTDLTPEAVHELGLNEVARIQGQLRDAFTNLGYPADGELSELIARAVSDAGDLPMTTDAEREEVLRTWQAIIDAAEERLSGEFRLRPTADVTVVAGMGGEYYVPGASDGSHPCEFRVSQSSDRQPVYMMRNIAYHEAVPGHHYQIGLSRELGLPPFRDEIDLMAFTEGWAVYGERLAWEAGLYDDDPLGNVGRLLCDLLRAARLVADTGIHAHHWTREEARAYMDETAGTPPGTFDDEVDRFIVAPAMATANEVGMIEILAMRERASAALGQDFDIRDFHDTVIGQGSMPIVVLRSEMERFVAAKTAN